MAQTDLLLVDDDAAFRAMARALLTTAGFGVLAEAATGADAIEIAAAVVPAAVLLDVQLPDIDGFEVARRLREQPRPPAVVLISTREASDYGRRVREAGVDGFISKAQLSGDALRAILRSAGRS